MSEGHVRAAGPQGLGVWGSRRDALPAGICTSPAFITRQAWHPALSGMISFVFTITLARVSEEAEAWLVCPRSHN